MSAWIVTKAHIDALMTAAVEWRLISNDCTDPLNDPTAIGQMLWKENYKSVNYRYSQRDRCPKYRFQRRATPLSAVEVIKSVHCLEYQSCEHKGWTKSAAKKFCAALISAATSKLPGYNDAPWGIDEAA